MEEDQQQSRVEGTKGIASSRVGQLAKEFEHVSKRQRTCIAKAQSELDDLIEYLEGLKKDLSKESSPLNAKEAFGLIQKQVRDKQDKIAKEQKDFHASLSKFGKLVDKSFNPDIDRAYMREWKHDKRILNEIVAEHLYREGYFEVADKLVQEAAIGSNTPTTTITTASEQQRQQQQQQQQAMIQVDESYKEPFVKMYKILEALKRRDLDPALQWCAENRDKLAIQNRQTSSSSLEFRLHRLKYVQFLMEAPTPGGDSVKKAIEYARHHFAPFASQHMDEIRRLMTALLYAGRLESSPYADLLKPSHWTDAEHQFTRDCCTLMGKPHESHLYVAVTAGSIAIPTLLKVSQFMNPDAVGIEWEKTDQMKYEIELGPEYQFHSVFSCAVSREQATRENPPMLLPCGHVLAKLSLTNLVKGSAQRCKCPYCPQECTLAQCHVLHF